jgi:hypothetical protein
MTHRVVGYDPITETVRYEGVLPEAMVMSFAIFGPSDPLGYDSYRLGEDRVAALGLPPELEYFIEPAPASQGSTRPAAYSLSEPFFYRAATRLRA